jgi:hypothetical protein
MDGSESLAQYVFSTMSAASASRVFPVAESRLDALPDSEEVLSDLMYQSSAECDSLGQGMLWGLLLGGGLWIGIAVLVLRLLR